MKKVVLLCVAGLSTSILVNKIREAAKNDGFDCQVDAYAVAEAQQQGEGADVILIGPQARFHEKNIVKLFPSTPVAVIDMKDYGTLNGQKVLEQAKDMMGV